MESDFGSVDMLNEYLKKNYQGTYFTKVDEYAGGHKRMSCDVFMAAVDYLDVEAFIVKFSSVKWDKPNEALLMVKTENDKSFVIYHP